MSSVKNTLQKVKRLLSPKRKSGKAPEGINTISETEEEVDTRITLQELTREQELQREEERRLAQRDEELYRHGRIRSQSDSEAPNFFTAGCYFDYINQEYREGVPPVSMFGGRVRGGGEEEQRQREERMKCNKETTTVDHCQLRLKPSQFI